MVSNKYSQPHIMGKPWGSCSYGGIQNLSDDCLLVAKISPTSPISWCTGMLLHHGIGPSLVTGSSFAVAGLRVWNSLPALLRDTNSIYSFRKQLKAYFSGGCRAWWPCFCALQILLLTYLLTKMFNGKSIVTNFCKKGLLTSVRRLPWPVLTTPLYSDISWRIN